jgi:hypothetical protein
MIKGFFFVINLIRNDYLTEKKAPVFHQNLNLSPKIEKAWQIPLNSQNHQS